MLSGQTCYKNPELDAVATDDKWIACDVATSYISDNLILAFFHGINGALRMLPLALLTFRL